VPFEIPTLENGGVPMHNGELGHFIGSRKGSHETKLLINEYIRTKEQKHKNEEYLPMFELIHKSIHLLNEKIEAQKQVQPNTKVFTDMLAQFSRQQGININEEMIAKAFKGFFVDF
jgi:hypothetical protein